MQRAEVLGRKRQTSKCGIRRLQFLSGQLLARAVLTHSVSQNRTVRSVILISHSHNDIFQKLSLDLDFGNGRTLPFHATTVHTQRRYRQLCQQRLMLSLSAPDHKVGLQPKLAMFCWHRMAPVATDRHGRGHPAFVQSGTTVSLDLCLRSLVKYVMLGMLDLYF